MKSLEKYIYEKLVINKNTKMSLEKKYKPTNPNDLRDIIVDKYDKNHKSIDCSDIDISNIGDELCWEVTDGKTTYYYGMFEELEELEKVDVSGWDTSQIDNINELFSGCKNLKRIIGIEKWNIDNLKFYHNAFKDVPVDVIPSWYKK